jgi:hypothetical protein
METIRKAARNMKGLPRVRGAWLCRLILFCLVASNFLLPQTSAQSPQIGYKSAADAEQKKTLLLKDFKPVSMLHAPAHEIDRAKFYVIDVHNHVNDAARIDEHMPPERVVEVMDRTNVKTIVILTGMWGDKLQAVIDEMVKPYPGRFMVFTQLDWSKVDDPNFGAEMAAQIRDSVARGARGLKFLKDLGLGVREKSEGCSPLMIPALILSGKNADVSAFRYSSIPAILRRSSVPLTQRTSAMKNSSSIRTGASMAVTFPAFSLCWKRGITSSRSIRTRPSFRCTWAGPKISTGCSQCSISILM